MRCAGLLVCMWVFTSRSAVQVFDFTVGAVHRGETGYFSFVPLHLPHLPQQLPHQICDIPPAGQWRPTPSPASHRALKVAGHTVAAPCYFLGLSPTMLQVHSSGSERGLKKPGQRGHWMALTQKTETTYKPLKAAIYIRPWSHLAVVHRCCRGV